MKMLEAKKLRISNKSWNKKLKIENKGQRKEKRSMNNNLINSRKSLIGRLERIEWLLLKMETKMTLKLKKKMKELRI